jgi:hypothetical protein
MKKDKKERKKEKDAKNMWCTSFPFAFLFVPVYDERSVQKYAYCANLP